MNSAAKSAKSRDRRQKFPCPTCAGNVGNEHCVQSEHCAHWYHSDCAQLTSEEFSASYAFIIISNFHGYLHKSESEVDFVVKKQHLLT